MTTTAVESIPGVWDDARDIPFSRATARLFSPELRLSASLLLARDDNDTADTEQLVPTPRRPSTTAPAGADDPIRPQRDLIPARVRRTR